MSATIVIENFPDINSKGATLLSADAAATDASVNVENTQGFATNDFFYLGTTGTEQIEKQQVASVAAQVLSLVDSLSFNHKRFSLVQGVYGDQFQVYRASNVDGSVPADGSFATLGSPVEITPDQPYTTYADNSGGSDYWYKYVYYNSDSASEVTNLNDVNAVRGGGYGDYASVEDIKAQAGISKNPYITDNEVALKRLGVQAEIDAALNSMYAVPFGDSIPNLVQQVCILMTAGYILIAEYGVTASGTSKDGKEMLQEGRDLLTKIAGGTADLVDGTGASLVSTNRVQGWPNDTTKDALASDGGGARIHRMSDRF